MPTTVVKSIGTSSRDYSTVQAWEDACPADLTAVDQIWKGECYNDSELAGMFMAGITTDGTRYPFLTAAAGQSFQDHASVRSNPLRYDQSKGVGLLESALYSTVIRTQVVGLRVSRLQLKNSHPTNGRVWWADAILANAFLSDSYCEAARGAGEIFVGGSFGRYSNVVIVQRAAGGNAAFVDNDDQFYGCTFLCPSDVAPGGTACVITGYGNTRVMQNCAIFGFSVITGDPSSTRWDTTTSKNNATDLASGLVGSSNQHSVGYTQFTPFTDADKDSLDLRAIAATSLIANGFLNVTYPNDISGKARSATPTIGAWEVAAAAATSFPSNLLRPFNMSRGRM